jgi:hypothetical protein
MDPRSAILADGKKFLWDGRLYDRHEDAVHAADSYKKDNFEVRVVVEAEKSLVYTRRVVQPTAVAAQQ